MAVDYSRGGSFYGNIGRCLYFKGKNEPALSCLIKSAWLLESARDEAMLLNQGWAALWIGQVLERQKSFENAYICFRRAESKWKSISPPRAETAKTEATKLLNANNLSSLGLLEDWQIDRQFLDWLGKIKRFPNKKAAN